MRRARRAGPVTPGIGVFVENLPGNVYRRVRRSNGSYYFEYLSSGLFRQFGIDHERLLAETSIRFDWVHPDDQARMVADLEVSAATLRLLDHRIRVVGHDGGVHWARGIGRPSRRSDGSTAWDGIVIDVTREVEAEAALRIAKAEADRAHGSAAYLVTEAARHLGTPVRELGRLLDAPAVGGRGADRIRAIRKCHARLASALGRLGSSDPAPRPGDRSGGGPNLTRRQREVHALLLAGHSNKAIAQALAITPGTAKLHVAAVLRAVGASSRRQVR